MHIQPWEVEFGKLTDTFRIKLRKLFGKTDTAAVRSTLRTYIDMLGDIYGKIWPYSQEVGGETGYKRKASRMARG